MTSRAPTDASAAGLVLAAGEGRRLGGPKALVRLDDELLVERAVRVARAGGCDPVLVVLGAAADEVMRTADLRADVVVNPSWSTGMSSSLSRGLDVLTERGAPAAVVLLVDQPEVSARTVQRLTTAWRAGARAAVATYGGKQRNPVLLDAATWPEVVAAATGDIGARAWLRAHADEVTPVACDDLGGEGDIDTPADLDMFGGTGPWRTTR